MKTTLRYCFIHRRPSSKSLQIVSAGENVEKKQQSYTVGGSVNWHSDYGEQYEGSLKN